MVTEITKAQLNPQMDVMTWDLTSNLHIDFRVILSGTKKVRVNKDKMLNFPLGQIFSEHTK